MENASLLLVEESGAMAEAVLEKTGSCLPFAQVLDPQGRPRTITPDELIRPGLTTIGPAEIFAYLVQLARGGKITAATVAFESDGAFSGNPNVNMRALLVHFEGPPLRPMLAFRTFEIKEGKVTYLQDGTQEALPRIFGITLPPDEPNRQRPVE